jgi:uncharacterized protein
MDYIVPWLAALALLMVLIAGWILTLLSLPGNWLMVVGVAAYAALVPHDWRVAIGWPIAGAVFAVALCGEVLEWLTVAVGTSRAGGSRRAALLALGGSLVGGFVGAVVGLPIPIVGSVVAIVLFAAVGAACGAVAGEFWKGRTARASWHVGQAAFRGRLLGAIAKIGAATAIVLVTSLALVLR